MNTPLYLNIGCGDRHLEGFVNVDTLETADVVCDVTQGLPFDDDSVDAIVHEHFIEHVNLADGVRFFMECRRVLKPGGIMRVATPDLDAVVQDYGRDNFLHEDWRNFGYDWVQTRAEMLNLAMREWGHRWLYNEEELRRVACLAGFDSPVRRKRGESPYEHLSGLEYRAGSRLVLEMTKPERRVREAPLVSILIASYNPRFFREALESALAQDYPRFEIVVTDDDRSGEIETIVHSIADPRVRYHRNPERLGGIENHLEAFAQARGEYIKFLSDDDVLAPSCVRKLAACLQHEPSVTLATSYRQRIDENGETLEDIQATRRIVGEPARINGARALELLLASRINYIGEPSTALFRRADLEGVLPNIFSVGGRTPPSNVDVSVWTNLLCRGDLVYLPEPLSSFRIHAEQGQRDPEVRQKGERAWDWVRHIGAHLGLWRPEGPRALAPRPLYPIPWWTARTGEAIRHVVHALGQNDLASAREAAKACADEDLDDPTVMLLHIELRAELVGPRGTLDALTTALKGREWFLPGQMRLIQLLLDNGEHALAEQLLEALNRMTPVLTPSTGFDHTAGRRLLQPHATLDQVGGCPPLRLIVGLRRPLHLASSTLELRVEADGEDLAEWRWAADGTDETLLELSLPPSQGARLVHLRWDVARAPFAEPAPLPPLELERFEVRMFSPTSSERASA